MLKNIHLILVGVVLFAGFSTVLDWVAALLAAIMLSLIWIAFNVFSIKNSLFLKSICRINTAEKVVFLSFDDGPSEKYTPLILKTLKEKKIQALFFCIGRYAELFPELIQKLSLEGHKIGNHTYNHKWENAFNIPAKIVSEIETTSIILNKISGQEIGLFRPPFGITNPFVAKAVNTLEMQSVGWDIRSFDTVIKDPAKLIHRICSRLRPGSIILLHDNREITSLVLGELIDTIYKQGYKILPFPGITKTT
jgi:peptidoglycan-N-acetylglucosamine deacetylase